MTELDPRVAANVNVSWLQGDLQQPRLLDIRQQPSSRDRSQPADQGRPGQGLGVVGKLAVGTQIPEDFIPGELEHGDAGEDENHLDVERGIDHSFGRARH